MLKLDLEYHQQIFIIRLKGSLKKNKTFKIYNYIIPVLEKHKIKKVIINMKDLTEVDESGIDAILKIKCILKRNGGKIILCELNKKFNSLFKRLHLLSLSEEKLALKMIEV